MVASWIGDHSLNQKVNVIPEHLPRKTNHFIDQHTIHYKHILRPDNGNNFYCVSFRWVVKTKLSWEYDVWNEWEGRQAGKYTKQKKIKINNKITNNFIMNKEKNKKKSPPNGYNIEIIHATC